MRRLLLLFFVVTLCTAQFDSIYTIASSWSMWSAWSTCAPEGVMIRVRACSTVRGFKCVGRNKEFKSCELRPTKGDEDFDQVDEDRQMAMKQLYQDYDLHADVTSLPTQFLQHVSSHSAALPPGHDVVPPGARYPVAEEESRFKGEFTSVERIADFPKYVQSNAHVDQQLKSEELMEEITEENGPTRPPQNLPSVPPQRPFKAKYIPQEPTTVLTTTTEEEEIEEEFDSEATESPEPFPDIIRPDKRPVEQETPVSVLPEMRTSPSTTTTSSTSTTVSTTPATTTIPETELETTALNFEIKEESTEPPVLVHPIFKYFPKIHGRTMIQKPTVLGVDHHKDVQITPVITPFLSVPRLPSLIHHSGEIHLNQTEEKALKEGRKRLRKMRKNRRRKPTTPAPDEIVTGDTARALSWLIANMTSSIGAESQPVSDTVVLEKYSLKTKTPRWTQWSLWSECRCGLQRRKRICLPNSSELIEGGSVCPSPEVEEKDCLSDNC